VLSFNYIKATALSLLISSLSASTAQAANLTPKESRVCPSLRVCIDVIRRHDATEFDYNVLEEQFRQFGPSGREALFDVLDSKAGNADIARMMSRLGPLSMSERSRIKKKWTQETSANYLPLLLDGHPFSRDLLLLSLGSDQVFVREASRQALIRLPKAVQNQPLSHSLRAPLLAALARDPIAEAAPYLARLNADGQQEKFAELLRSADSSIVSGAYAALYRNSPSQAFSLLLSEMGRATSSEQSQAIGEMLLRRHAGRQDGFYLKFARDISGDMTRPISARASGFHAVMSASDFEIPEFTQERAEALAFLIKGQPFITQEKYLPFLKRAKAERELNFIWNIAQREKWINRDQISKFFEGKDSESKVISDLIMSDDFRSFRAGVMQAKLEHKNLIRAQMDHAIKPIAQLAHQKLGLPVKRYPNNTCWISQFDSQDMLNQMPFFNKGWATIKNQARVALDREFLTAAHPSKMGWLAGYNLDFVKSGSTFFGGGVVHFSNKTGDFKQVGKFLGPLAILPDRALRLGQTTETFWIIDHWKSESSDVSAYLVDVSAPTSKISHLGALPNTANRFSVAPNGDLLIGFNSETQAPIRLTQTGDLSRACSAPRRAPQVSAPN